jgi:hypothetical protein
MSLVIFCAACAVGVDISFSRCLSPTVLAPASWPLDVVLPVRQSSGEIGGEREEPHEDRKETE